MFVPQNYAATDCGSPGCATPTTIQITLLLTTTPAHEREEKGVTFFHDKPIRVCFTHSRDLSYPKIFQNTFESLEIAILKNDMLYE